MKNILLLLAVLIAATFANAASLTVAQALELRAGLQALDGQTQIIKVKDRDGVVSDTVVQVPYKFSSEARWKIFGALTILKPFLETFDGVRQNVAKVTGADVDPKNEAKAAAFSTEINKELQKRSDDLKLPLLSRADLNLTDNQIPGSVLGALAPIIQP